jgi:hypothetical protein
MDVDDVQGRAVAGPPRYNAAPAGAVKAAAVVRGGATVGYLYVGVDDDDSAGLVATRAGDFQPEGSGYWLTRLRDLKQRGVPAPAAIEGLLGVEGPAPAGRVSPTLEEYPSKADLERFVNPESTSSSRRVRSASPSRDEIDAALSGKAPMTPPIRDRVAQLDDALARKPTPEAIVVTLTDRGDERFSPGQSIREPGYLTARLLPVDRTVPGVRSVVRLRVPPGIPALFQPPRQQGDSGILLLARGIEWVVDDVIDLPGQKAVVGHVIEVSPTR